MKQTLLFAICIFTFFGTSQAQLQKGDRTLAWQIDLAENNDYDSAFAYGYDACMESVHLFFKWTDVEADTGVWNTTFITSFLDIMDIYYPAWNMDVELQIAPINTGVKEVPSELNSLPFDDPIVINRFKILLDTVFAHIPNVTLSALNIGNEGDANFGTNATLYNQYKVFLDSVASHAKSHYFNLHGSNLKVGTTFTFHGLTDNATASLCKTVNNGLDIVTTTYYPLNNDFTMKPPSVVSTDFGALVTEYPDTAQPIYLAECGYASSTLCNSSEALQAQFWSEVFTAWDTYYDNIKHLTVFKSTDWSTAVVNQLGQYYNIQDTIFKEYLRTLGVRTWDGDGTNKLAYEQILCELDDRNWCNVSCNITGMDEGAESNITKVFPNPANETATVQLPNNGFPYHLKIFDAHGKMVREITSIKNSKLTIRRENVPTGIYFLYITNNDKVVHTEKLLFK